MLKLHINLAEKNCHKCILCYCVKLTHEGEYLIRYKVSFFAFIVVGTPSGQIHAWLPEKLLFCKKKTSKILNVTKPPLLGKQNPHHNQLYSWERRMPTE